MVDNGDVIDAVKAIDSPVFTSHEVADRLPIGAERTRTLLGELVENGVICRKQVGNGYAYYFPPCD